LNGLDYLQKYNLGDYEAINWLNSNVSGTPVIVEAVGSNDINGTPNLQGDYSDYGRVSAYTGLPTIMAWVGHEYQWRVNWMTKDNNSTDFNRRTSDIISIYTSSSQAEVLALLARYNAQYIYVGDLERLAFSATYYPNVNLTRFASFMKIAYQKDGVTIYQVK
jgi:uncharacterized membrane protein